MGGGEKSKTNEMTQEQYKTENTAANQFAQQQEAGRQLGQQHGSDLYGQLSQGYGNLASNNNYLQSLMPGFNLGGYSAAHYSAVPQYNEALSVYRNFAQSGGIDENAMRVAHPSYQNFIQTGGIDQNRQQSIDQTVNALRQFGLTGGVDQTAQNRIRGGGGYEEFANTGGYNAGDLANIRSRATSVIPAAYQQAQDQANRMRSVQGGYGPGATSLQGRALRDANAQSADAALNAELGIKQAVNQGRQFGITGMAGSEQGLQSLLSQNKLGGLSGSGQLDMALANAIQQGREFGTQGLDTSEARIQGMGQQGRMFGTQGVESIAGALQDVQNRNAAASASAANMNYGQQLDLAKLNLGAQLSGLGGLQSLYSGGPSGEIQYADQANLANRGQRTGASQGIINSRYANNPSFMDRLPSLLGAGANIAGMAAGGFAPFMGQQQRRSPNIYQPSDQYGYG